VVICCLLFVSTARGLDIPHIRVVVNYDVARDIDTHTHRIGRTGRAGQKGTAYTLVSTRDKDFAGHLVRNLEGANQFVPPELMDLAMQACCTLCFVTILILRFEASELLPVRLYPAFHASSVAPPLRVTVTPFLKSCLL
jgi:Helicase conserved C-terminal domain